MLRRCSDEAVHGHLAALDAFERVLQDACQVDPDDVSKQRELAVMLERRAADAERALEAAGLHPHVYVGGRRWSGVRPVVEHEGIGALAAYLTSARTLLSEELERRQRRGEAATTPEGACLEVAARAVARALAALIALMVLLLLGFGVAASIPNDVWRPIDFLPQQALKALAVAAAITSGVALLRGVGRSCVAWFGELLIPLSRWLVLRAAE
jgi:hypothetical protein